jgi:hypothetical protein
MTTGQIILVAIIVIAVSAIIGGIAYQDYKSKQASSSADVLSLLHSPSTLTKK